MNKSHLTNHPYLRYLPQEYAYTKISTVGSEIVTFCCNQLKTEERVRHWVKEFGERSYVEWRISRTNPRLKRIKCIFKLGFRCQHSRSWYQAKSSSGRTNKNIQCPASLQIGRYKSRYEFGTVTRITLTHEHNHETGQPSDINLKYRDVSSRAQSMLRELYTRGHSPVSARHFLLSDVFMQSEEDFVKISADRNQVPDLSYCYNLFYKEFKSSNGLLRKTQLFDTSKLESILKEWSTRTGGCYIIGVFDDKTQSQVVLICMVTPLMLSVHQKVPESAETVYLETREKVCMLSVETPAGNLPLGLVITSSNDSKLVKKSLNLYKALVNNETFFYGRGAALGPKNLVLDCGFDKDWLRRVWPCTNLLSGTSEVLKSLNCWMIGNGMKPDDRGSLLFEFKKVLLAESEADMMNLIDALEDSGRKYPLFLNYVSSNLLPRRGDWALCYRGLIEKNAYIAYAFRAVKDIFLNPPRNFNFWQLLDFMLARFDQYYLQRISGITNGEVGVSELKRWLPDCEGLSFDRIKELENGDFLVENADWPNLFLDFSLGLCTCVQGLTGHLCKHQCAVALYKASKSPDISAIDMESTLVMLLSIVSTNDTPKTEENLVVIEDSSEEEMEDDEHNEIIIIEVEGPESDDVEELGSGSDHMTNLEDTFQHILHRFESNPVDKMLKVSQDFCEAYGSFCKDDDSLKNALCTFGKNEIAKQSRPL